jgi:hypothetical protein
VTSANVTGALDDLFKDAAKSTLSLLFSLRHDFPTEWSAFVNSSTNAPFAVHLKSDYFPYFTHGRAVTIEAIALHATASTPETIAVVATTPFDITLPLPSAGSILQRNADASVFLIVRYSFQSTP